MKDKMNLRLFLLFTCVLVKGNDDVIKEPNSSLNLSYNASNNMTGPTCERTEFHVVFFTCLIIFIPITIVGNASVCLVVTYTKTLRIQPMYMYMASLAFADTFVGVISMPLKAKIEWDGGCFCLPWWVCWMFMLEEITFSVASTIHLFAIGIDRYLALRFAYNYKRLMSRGKYALVLVCIWMTSVICSLMSLFQWQQPSKISISPGSLGCAMNNTIYFTTLYALFYLSPVFLLIFLYWHIYKIAAHHVNEISKVEVHESNSEKKAQRRRRHLKLLRSVVIVFMAYAICWMPCIIFILIILQHKSLVMDKKNKHWFRIVKFILIDFLPHLNSTLNPFIYVLSNKEFVVAMHAFLFRIPGVKTVLRKSNSSQLRYENVSLGKNRKKGVQQFNMVSHTETSFF